VDQGDGKANGFAGCALWGNHVALGDLKNNLKKESQIADEVRQSFVKPGRAAGK